MTSSQPSSLSHPEGNSPVRRVITGHTADGKAIILDDTHIEPYPLPGGSSIFSDVFWSDSNPPENGVMWTDLTKENRSKLVGPSGSSFRAIDMPSGGATVFHRTVTLDYAIVVKGTITLILDDDKRVKLNAGDVAVQRGTIHGWVNEGAEWTRVFFVMIPSQKVQIGDKQLEQVFEVAQKGGR